MNGLITVWVITWRTAWPVMLCAVLAPPLALILRRHVALAPGKAFFLPLLGPLLIIARSGLFWAAEARTIRGVHWASDVLIALVLLGLALAVGVALRFRRTPHYWTVVVIAAANAIFVLAAGFVGGMAISNSWL